VDLSLPLDGRVVLFTIAFSLMAALLSGVTPALHASKADVVAALNDESQGPSDPLRVRSTFVIAKASATIRHPTRSESGVALRYSDRSACTGSTRVARMAAQLPASNAGRGMLARPLRQEVVGDIGATLWLLFAAVALVLLIACVNVASLLLARAVSRERELATRVALGASRARVIRQCLTESGLLGLIGGLAGILLATASVRPFITFWPGALPRAGEIHLDWRVLLAALAVSLASGLTFGLAPAMQVPMGGVETALRGGSGTIARSSRRLHGAFVVTELALAVVLLVSAGSDQATTIAVFRRYPLAREVDPIYAWTGRSNEARILAGTAVDAGIVLLARRVHRTHPTLAVFVLSALAGVRMAQTAQNVRLSADPRRSSF
jgi:HAMP domain-containing protein